MTLIKTLAARYCPQSHPFSYYQGRECCAVDQDKDGKSLTIDWSYDCLSSLQQPLQKCINPLTSEDSPTPCENFQG